MTLQRAEKFAYYFAYALSVYMPLHIFLSQWLSTFTGGLEVWKAAKDVILVLVVFPLLFLAYKQGAFKSLFFKRFFTLGACYVALYMLFLLFDRNADLKSAITGSVYNTRLLGYFLLGYVVANSKAGSAYARTILKVTLIMCLIVASFGVLQYFLPKDFLTYFGYAIERGVKPFFFINEDPRFPRIMSTLRDPNSLGAYLVFPLLLSFYGLLKGKKTKAYRCLFIILSLALYLSFSRAAWIGFIIGISIVVLSVYGKNIFVKSKKYSLPILLIILVLGASIYFYKDTTFVRTNLFRINDQNHSTEIDSDGYHIKYIKQGANGIINKPIGHGPGTAGIVSIQNKNGTVLTENYYLQIGYEVGIVGLAIFLSFIYLLSAFYLNKLKHYKSSIVFLACIVSFSVMSLVMHLWSNEAVALVWWLSVGLSVVILQKNNDILGIID